MIRSRVGAVSGRNSSSVLGYPDRVITFRS
jgi:hypothetical protein